MRKDLLRVVCMVAGAAVSAGAAGDQRGWLDNERQFKSSDANYNVRRSDHFRIMWGKGAASRKEENNDFPQVTEQLAQGNLQMLEAVWHRYHDPQPRGIGFHATGFSVNTNYWDGRKYRINLVMNNTGIWEGGAWGACDEWGFPLFALPPSYLSFDTPSGATPHEYGHTVLINAGGFNDTPYDGMWHEATANWLQLQFLNSYPGPGGVGLQPYLSVPHGRNYYDAWQIWEYLAERPEYGYAFINKVWTQAHGSKDKGAEYIFDAMARLDTSGSPDHYNTIKDIIGSMAAHNVTWDYRRQQFFQKQTPYVMDPLNVDMYRRPFTELERRQGDRTWYRCPFAHAPMQNGYTMVPIALVGKTCGAYRVNVNFKPLWDPQRRSDWRATLVAVSDNGDARYSTLWNGGINSLSLAADENRLYLVVSATPDFMGFEGFAHPLISDLPLQPQAYEVAFPDTQATAFESVAPKPAVAGKPHTNGGGFVADSAAVEPTAYVGPHAQVRDHAQVRGTARIEDYAVVMNDALVKDNARVSGHALVKDRAQVTGNGKVRDWATVQGTWKVFGNGRVLEHATLLGGGNLFECATIKGNACDYGDTNVYGHAIKEGDCANGVTVSNQVLMCWVWGFDQDYANKQTNCGALYCCYEFKRTSPLFALDTFGVMHGYLMGGPATVALDDPGHRAALSLNGAGQYIELKRDVADFNDTTIALWLNWTGDATDSRIVHFGDGGGNYAYLTPRGGKAGTLAFVISTNGPAGEQAIAAPAALASGRWVHVAVTLNGSTGTLYVDGAPVAANTALTLDPDMVLGANCLDGTTCTFVGRSDKGDYLSGLITDFRIYVNPQEARTIKALATTFQNRAAAAVASTQPKGEPTPAAFLVKPTVLDDRSVVMSAVKQTDTNTWWEYQFTCTSGGGHSSGWISANRWTDCAIVPGATCTYTCAVRGWNGAAWPASEPASVTVPRDAEPPKPVAFETGPVGIATNAIRMVACTATDANRLVEYQFTRNDGVSSGWQASRTWTDTSVADGSTNAYTLEVRDGNGIAGKPAAAVSAVARDDAPPARYRLGEWQTLPYATLSNCVAMRAMSVTGEDGAPKIEDTPVEYYFQCVSSNAPDSGWIPGNVYTTSHLRDGIYRFRFKIRDTSPQHNETPFSSVETAAVTKRTGYHSYSLAAAKRQHEGTLVSLKGRITGVETNAYTLSSGGTSLTVMPRTVASATDASFMGKDVVVNGCMWTCSNELRVVWAEVK